MQYQGQQKTVSPLSGPYGPENLFFFFALNSVKSEFCPKLYHFWMIFSPKNEKNRAKRVRKREKMTEETVFPFPGPHVLEKKIGFCLLIGYRKLYCPNLHVFDNFDPKNWKKTGPNRIREVRFDKMYYSGSKKISVLLCIKVLVQCCSCYFLFFTLNTKGCSCL